MLRRVFAGMVLPALALAMGCGGHEPKASRGAAAKAARVAPLVDGSGRLVAIDGRRRLYVQCEGTGSPTVLLEAGFGADARSWQDVQPQVGRATRTCAYDRAGTGNSVAPPGVRGAREEIADLRGLLARLGIGPPYVIVGHSYGGVLARVFARTYPTDTAGLVLIDTMGRDGRRRQLAVWPPSQAPEDRAELSSAVIGNVDLAIGEGIASRITTLGDMPLAVITAGRQDNFPRRPARLGRALQRLWDRMQDELATLSDNSVHVVALASNHDIPSPRSGQPAVIVRAVQAVVGAARSDSRLPPCRRLFRGLEVRCHT